VLGRNKALGKEDQEVGNYIWTA